MHLQAALHVMAQRSAVLQIDHDQTVDILRKITQDAAYQEILLLKAQTRCDQERHLRLIAMAAVGILRSKVEFHQRELSTMVSVVAKYR